MQKWPLVGREEELSYIRAIISGTAYQGVVIGGAAGVGKTRLLGEVLAALEDHRIERVTATRSAQLLPFGALAQFWPEGVQSDRVDLLAVVGAGLRRRAGDLPMVLAVDDAHLLDPMSAAFVHHVVDTGLAKVVLSIRSGEAAPDAIVALYRDEVLPRLELTPISRAEFDSLIEVVLGGPVESGTLERLWATAAGNALYVRELVLDAVEAGTLAQVRGAWRWEGRAGAAPRLREVVFSHIGKLPDAQRQLLDYLAIGEPLDASVVEALVPEVSLGDAERRGLISIETVGLRSEIRLGHPLFAEALILALPAADRRRHHQALADAVEMGESRRREDPLRLAMWRLEAGSQPDAQVLTDAATLANRLGDPRMAERLAMLAVSDSGSFEARLQLVIALADMGHLERAEAELRGLIGVEPPTEEGHEILADALMTVFGIGQGRIDEALTLMIEVEHQTSNPQIRALIQTHRATLLAFAARFSEASAVGEAALLVADDPATRVRALTSVGISWVMVGQIDRALAFNDEMFPIALELQDRLPRAPGWVLTNRSTALLLSGRFAETLELIDFGLAALPRIDDGVRVWERSYRGRIALAQGKPATAQRYLKDATASYRPGVVSLPESWCLSLLAEATALKSDADGARSIARQAVDAAEPGYVAFDADERRARAWVRAAEGRISDAVAELIEAADLARSRGQFVFELLALSDALRLGETRVAQRIADLAATTDGLWSTAIGQHAQAVLRGDPLLLESAASAFESIGSDLVASELLAAASAGHAAAGLRSRSAETSRRSRDLAARCENAWTPAFDTAFALVPLSRREREVAGMAAKGHTNSEIAAELHLSVRTVESHLYSAFFKLGVTDRRDLDQALS